MARFEFGDERVGELRYEADIKVAIAGCRGAFTACVLEAGIPALWRKGALEALGGQLEFERDISTNRNHGVDVPPKVNEMGRSVLSVVACVDRGRSSVSISVLALSRGELEKGPRVSIED